MGKKGTPSFLEATLVLMVIVLGIAIGVVGLKVSPNITILAAIGMVMLYAVIKRYRQIGCTKESSMASNQESSQSLFLF